MKTWTDQNKNIIFKYFLYIILYIIIGISLYIYIPEIMSLFNIIYDEYMLYIHKVKGEHLKWVLENRLTIDYTSHTEINDKFNKFIDLNKEWRNELKDNLNDKNIGIVKTIINELNIDFKSFTDSIHNTPNMTSAIFEARFSHPLAPNHPLGLQGINHNFDEIVKMLNNYLIEHGSQSLERLNYQSNIMYILVNGLS